MTDLKTAKNKLTMNPSPSAYIGTTDKYRGYLIYNADNLVLSIPAITDKDYLGKQAIVDYSSVILTMKNNGQLQL